MNGVYLSRDDALFIIETAYERICKIAQFTLLNSETILNPYIVTEVVERFERDMERFFRFHPEIDTLSLTRQYAYLSYWIVKLKPIHILSRSSLRRYIRISNEILAFIILLSSPEINHYKLRDISRRFINELLYTFRYRNITADNLYLMVQFLLEN